VHALGSTRDLEAQVLGGARNPRSYTMGAHDAEGPIAVLNRVRGLFRLTAQRATRLARGSLSRTPEQKALRKAQHKVATVARYTPGAITLGPYRIEYGDLLTVIPQWNDMFIDGSLRFRARTDSPRVLDCGANVGIASLYLKHLYPKARVTAFEADPMLAAMCARNLAANGHGDVDVQKAAVWTGRGTVEFRPDGGDTGRLAAVGGPLNSLPGVTVPSVRLRDYLSEPVDLLKLDIEGAELAVLDDCADLLEGVEVVIIEIHEFEPDSRMTPAVLRLLTGAGYRFTLARPSPMPDPSDRGPFPAIPERWCMTAYAWRA
jgi:FkbM family methyltransferase